MKSEFSKKVRRMCVCSFFLAFSSLVLLCGLQGCDTQTSSQPQSQESPPKPSPTLTALPQPQNPEDIASELCHYSQGEIPFWFLIDEYDQWLTQDEALAIREIRDSIDKNLNPAAKTRRIAFDRFMAKTMQCSLLDAQIQSQEPLQIAYLFTQKIPSISRLQPWLEYEKLEPHKEQTWTSLLSAAFERSFYENPQMAYFEDKAVIVLEQSSNTWHLKSEIRNSYYRSLQDHHRTQEFARAIKRRHLPWAFELYETLCPTTNISNNDQNPELCAKWEKRIQPETDHWNRTKKYIFRIFLGKPEWIDISVSKNSKKSVAKVNLLNLTGIPFHSATLGYKGFSEHRTCLLQSELSFSNIKPLYLGVGELQSGWCVLPKSSAELQVVDLKFVE